MTPVEGEFIGQKILRFFSSNVVWYVIFGTWFMVCGYGRGLRIGFQEGAIKQRAYDEMDSKRVGYYISISPDTTDILWPHVGIETNFSRLMFENFADSDSFALAIIIDRAGLTKHTKITKTILDTARLVQK